MLFGKKFCDMISLNYQIKVETLIFQWNMVVFPAGLYFVVNKLIENKLIL